MWSEKFQIYKLGLEKAELEIKLPTFTGSQRQQENSRTISIAALTTQKMRWLDSITDPMDMNLSKLWDIMKNREVWHDVIYGVAKHDLATE